LRKLEIHCAYLARELVAVFLHERFM
jgi:hypothetical protein